MKKKLLLILAWGFSLLCITFFLYYNNLLPKNAYKTPSNITSKKGLPRKDLPLSPSGNSFTTIKITAVGDILAHDDQLASQYNKNTNTYNFDDNFKYITPYIKTADLSICNLETTLAGVESGGFSGYPAFNSPDELLYAAKNAGFNVISAVNNHCIDKGSYGVIRTTKKIKDSNLTLLGLRSNIEEKRYTIKNVKGIKVALCAYSFETPLKEGNKTINSIPIPKDVVSLLNTFNPGNKDYDLPQIIEQVNLMKRDGAEVIIMVMHWGDEYQRQENEYQKYMAKELINSGVNIILGSHPHVIEKMEYMADSYGKENLVVYSMGNILSNQRYERIGNRFTEDGVIVNVDITKDLMTGKISISNSSFIPTWVNRYPFGNHYGYDIVPLPIALKHKDSFNLNSAEAFTRATNSYNNTLDIMKDSSNIAVSKELSEDNMSTYIRTSQ